MFLYERKVSFMYPCDIVGHLVSHKSPQNVFRRIQTKGLSWLESIGPEVKRLRSEDNAEEMMTPSIAPVRFCICRYRRRVRKGSHDRNDRKVQPRAR